MAALAHPELEKKKKEKKKEEKGLLNLTLKAPRERGWGQVGSHPHVTATTEPKDLLPPRCQPEGVRFNQIHRNLHGRIRKPFLTLLAFQE